VSQPIAALLTNAETAVRWLARQPPDFEKIGPSIHRIVNDGKRAAGILSRIRDFLQKGARAEGRAGNQRGNFRDFSAGPCPDV
jgi:hypothetical protein